MCQAANPASNRCAIHHPALKIISEGSSQLIFFDESLKTSNLKLLKGCPKGEEVVDPLDSAMESFWSHHNDRIWTYEQV